MAFDIDLGDVNDDIGRKYGVNCGHLILYRLAPEADFGEIARAALADIGHCRAG
jgi:hypothetical protein